MANPVGIPSSNLDLTFSGDGIVTTSITSGNDEARGLGFQSDGKIVLAGTASNDFALVRYNANGTLDTSFSGDGIATVSPGTGNDTAKAVALAANGQIVLAGYSVSAGTDEDFSLARFNTDGSLDTTFGTGGSVITPISAGNVADKASAMAIQSDGKIVVVGNNDFDFIVARYNANGTLDTSFNAGGAKPGVAITSIENSSDYANAVLIQSDGKILVAGNGFHSSGGTFNGNIVLARYNADGTLDSSFDGDGKLILDLGTNETVNALALDAQGRIVLSGQTEPLAGGQSDIALWRLTAAGVIDTSFGGGDGVVTQDFGGGSDYGQSVLLQPDGKIIVGGSNSSGFSQAVLLRYDASGALDTGFDGDGVFARYFANGTSSVDALAITSKGELLAAGSSFAGSTNDFALLRMGALGAQTATAGSAFSYTVPTGAFVDADSNSLTFSATLAGGGALPSWLGFNPSTRTFSGTPASGDFGTYVLDIAASDGSGASSASLQLDVSSNMIQALMAGAEARWNAGFTRGTSASVTYSFMDVAPSYSRAADISSFEVFSTAQKSAAEQVLGVFSGIANITFASVADAGDGGQIRFGRSTIPGSTTGFASYPGTTPSAGDVWIDKSDAVNTSPTLGTYGYEVLMHEIGHALGLKHSFEDGTTLPSIEDTRLNTVMSYTDAPNRNFLVVTNLGGGSFSWEHQVIHPETPMVYDIAALQYLYGANNTFNSADNVYTFDPARPFFKTIWDGGGNDSISVSNFTNGSTIDLRDGRYSSIRVTIATLPAGANDSTTNIYDGSNNLGIAFDAIIENAIGGSGNDTLMGNAVANSLEGGAGNDTLTGGAGGDTFAFAASGNGSDTITDFGAGDRVRISGASLSGVIANGNGSAVAQNAVQFQTSGGNTTLFVGTNATLGAEAQITLTGAFAAGSLRVLGSDIFANAAPSAGAFGNKNVGAGQAVSLSLASIFTDGDSGDVLSFAASGLPAGVTINAASGAISGTAPNSVSVNNVVVTATDSGGLTANVAFDLAVTTGSNFTANVVTRDGLALPGVTAHQFFSNTPSGSLFGFKNIAMDTAAGTGIKTLTGEIVNTSAVTSGTLNVALTVTDSKQSGLTQNWLIDSSNGWTANASTTANSASLVASKLVAPIDVDTIIGKTNLTLPTTAAGDSVLDLSAATLGGVSSPNRSLNYSQIDMGTSGQLGANLADGNLALSLSRGTTDLVPAVGAKPITAADALDALKLSVGLDATKGSTFKELISADINKDGRVTAADALEILKVSVGINTIQPSWVFVPTDTTNNPGLASMTRQAVTYKDDLNLASLTAPTAASFTAILVGDVNNSWLIPS